MNTPKHSPIPQCPSVKKLCPKKTPPNSPTHPLPVLILEPDKCKLNSNGSVQNTN